MKRLVHVMHARHLVRFDLAVCALAIGIAGCTSGDSTGTKPPPQDVWNVVARRTWSMPAESEGYVCYAAQVTSDEYITGFRLVAPSAAQVQVLLTVSDAPVTTGSSACYPGSVAPHLIYAASVGTSPVEFPSGFGVHVAAGQYLWLNIHVANSGSSDITDSTRIEGRVGNSSDVTTPIDMTMAGTYSINIPADGQEHTATGACYADLDQHVLAILPIMRTRATHQTVGIIVDTTIAPFFDQDFSYSHDDYTLLDPAAQIHVGDHVAVRCSYVNDGPATATYNETGDNSEACFSLVYRYPIGAAGTFGGCGLQSGNFDIRRE